MTPRLDEGELAFPTENAIDEQVVAAAPPVATGGAVPELVAASAGRRLIACIIDLALLGMINVGVVYLTLALAGLRFDEFRVLPVAPMIGFFAILGGGYLVAFTAAGGQTIGKMATGIRVVGEHGARVDIGGAVLRAVGCSLSLLTAGLGYLPAFVSADRRALHDRISRTRVVSAG